MEQQMHNKLTSRKTVVSFVVFLIVIIWWLLIRDGSEGGRLLWAASYQVLAIMGGVIGLFIAKDWGSYKSVFGKAIIFFSLGLLAQAFGQTVFSYYNVYLHNDIPYPSIADLGFFGSVPLYLLGLYFLSKASGLKVSITRSFRNKILLIGLPIVILLLTYFYFLEGYDFSEVYLLQAILDFGYPLGQALYVSLAIGIYLILPKSILGGVMRFRVLLIILALIIQYVADYNFLLQAYNETWVNGSYGDVLYAFAYLGMACSIYALDRNLLFQSSK